VGERKHPDKSEFATPLVERNQFLIPLSEGKPEGRGGSKETTPSWLCMPPLFRAELIPYSPQRGVPEGRGGRKETTPSWLRMPPLYREELTSYSSCVKDARRAG